MTRLFLSCVSYQALFECIERDGILFYCFTNCTRTLWAKKVSLRDLVGRGKEGIGLMSLKVVPGQSFVLRHNKKSSGKKFRRELQITIPKHEFGCSLHVS